MVPQFAVPPGRRPGARSHISAVFPFTFSIFLLVPRLLPISGHARQRRRRPPARRLHPRRRPAQPRNTEQQHPQKQHVCSSLQVTSSIRPLNTISRMTSESALLHASSAIIPKCQNKTRSHRPRGGQNFTPTSDGSSRVRASRIVLSADPRELTCAGSFGVADVVGRTVIVLLFSALQAFAQKRHQTSAA